MISIIFPTLNEEKVLESTLSNLASKLALPHEIIVSDGKSIDKTTAIARKYANKVMIHSGDVRQTIAAGRNAGAAAAKGEFLVFMDADCQLEDPDHFFNEALSRFREDKDLVAVTARVKVFAKDEKISDKIFFGYLNALMRFSNNFLHKGNSAGEFQMIRKEAFDKVRGFKEYLVCAEDGDIFYRLSKIGKTRFESNLTVYHTGRRAHKIGWARLMTLWFLNGIYMSLFNRSFSKEWKAVR